jgi:hypothetical protein
MAPKSRPDRLSDLPLWRLLVALDDAERSVGADTGTARVLAREIQRRLRTTERISRQGCRAARGNEEV